ncbi:RDD family protein [Leptospira koniambonensis]|uniref:RDD family protein n=1 Tax=Leptospira koniambonensis TaxID=2484950 RepID=A0A4R9J4X7_9LEPT|nr:RDD family protein [Leptospira koniambonensis]TGL31328.1 RDD family protein [Leptospira koniambonensis]
MKYFIQFITFIFILIVFEIIITYSIEAVVGRELTEKDIYSSPLKFLAIVEFVFSFVLMRIFVKKGILPYNKEKLLHNSENQNPLIKFSASLADRYLAMVFDTIIMFIILILCAKTITVFSIENQLLRILILSPLFLYDPLFVYFFGVTPGHYLKGLKVVSSSNSKLTLLNCMIRFVLKFVLGMVSLVFLLTERKQALHDRITSTFVIYSKNYTESKGRS